MQTSIRKNASNTKSSIKFPLPSSWSKYLVSHHFFQLFPLLCKPRIYLHKQNESPSKNHHSIYSCNNQIKSAFSCARTSSKVLLKTVTYNDGLQPTCTWTKPLPPYLEWEALTTLSRRETVEPLRTLVRFYQTTLPHSQEQKPSVTLHENQSFFLQPCSPSKWRSFVSVMSICVFNMFTFVEHIAETRLKDVFIYPTRASHFWTGETGTWWGWVSDEKFKHEEITNLTLAQKT
jgi:hypothetical protein